MVMDATETNAVDDAGPVSVAVCVNRVVVDRSVSRVSEEVPASNESFEQPSTVPSEQASNEIDSVAAAASTPDEIEALHKLLKPRKVALTVGFTGTNYHGLQISYEPNVKTIEGEVVVALASIGALGRERHMAKIEKLFWQRSSRTDAGVHARVVVFTAKLFVEDAHVRGLVHKANALLPECIRIFDAVKMPKSFDAKKACSWREYVYVLPRSLVGDIDLFNKALHEFEGCHSYHNFSNVKGRDIDMKEFRKEKKEKEKENRKRKRDGERQGVTSETVEENGNNVEEVGGEAMRTSRNDADHENLDKQVETPAVSSEASGKGDEPRIPVWRRICIRQEDGTLQRRPEKMFSHTHGSIYRMRSKYLKDSDCLEIHIRGQFFLYNQIRIMIGTALAVSRSVLALDVIPLCLKSNIETHLPLAPPTGLCLHSAGFSNMDVRGGRCALDRTIYEATYFGHPTDFSNPDLRVRDEDRGYILLSENGEAACEAFYTGHIRPAILEGWKGDNWVEKCLTFVQWPEDLQATLEDDVRERREKDDKNEEFRRPKERQRRLDQLRDMTFGEDKNSRTNIAYGLPQHFATTLLCEFDVYPGPRFTNFQLALSQRMAADESMVDMNGEDLLAYVKSVGFDVLMEEAEAME